MGDAGPGSILLWPGSASLNPSVTANELGETSMVARHKSRGSRPKLIRRRPKRRPDVLWNVGLFAGYKGDCALELDDGFDLAEQLASHEPGDEARGAGEDAVPNDRDDQASEGPARSPTGRLALRSSRNGEHLRSERRKIDLDDENHVFRRIRDVGARCREPKHYHLGVLLFPKDADGWVRVVADSMAPSTQVSPETPPPRPPSPPAIQRGLKRRPPARNE
jgi:hypothetical protein